MMQKWVKTLFVSGYLLFVWVCFRTHWNNIPIIQNTNHHLWQLWERLIHSLHATIWISLVHIFEKKLLQWLIFPKHYSCIMQEPKNSEVKICIKILIRGAFALNKTSDLKKKNQKYFSLILAAKILSIWIRNLEIYLKNGTVTFMEWWK